MREQTIALYPFVSAAKEHAGRAVVSYSEIEAAANSVLDAITRKAPGAKPLHADAAKAVRRFALEKAVLAALGSYEASRKYASNRAREAAAWLREDDAELKDVAKDFFPSFDGESISLADYLKHGNKLVEQDLDGGRVYLGGDAMLDILKQAIALKLGEPGADVRRIPQDIQDVAEELREKLPQVERPRLAGKYLDLACVKKIIGGLPEGKRYYGAMTLAIACVNDGLSKDASRQVMEEYVAKCRKVSHDYTSREALTVLDWVYAHAGIRFSCNTAKSQGLTDEMKECMGCGMKRKPS